MIDVTTVPFIHLLSLISPFKNHEIFTEMFHANMFSRGKLTENQEKLKIHLPVLNGLWKTNITVQIGTSCPKEASLATKELRNIGMNKINLNVGCPSDNVQVRIIY
ncbi:hypothetical protein AYI70_g3545 [Smittium culicis]|uniref:DUS-like FMN-binding domain-containing protein n=1 Tax=Smittium culicis TaxID=133412 RepID=A0A1R1Y3F8_9FUNG|nr:hypothetical protein AYI70_g3545 [Smittium culicis]